MQIAELTAALKEKEMERVELWDAHVEASAAGARYIDTLLDDLVVLVY
jgi:hypothetical protein